MTKENPSGFEWATLLGLGGLVAYWLYSQYSTAVTADSAAAAAAVQAAASTTTTTTGTTVSPVTGTAQVAGAIPTWRGRSRAAAPPAAICSASGQLANIMAAAQGANPTLNLGPAGADTLTMAQWNGYANQVCPGLTQQLGFSRGNSAAALTWTQWSEYAGALGLSGYSGLGTHLVRRAA